MIKSPLLILSDLHLGPAAPLGADASLEALLGRFPERDVLVLGDLFDLSAEVGDDDLATVMCRKWAAHPPARAGISRHLRLGRRVTLVAGNHDAELVAPGAKRAILTSLDLPQSTDLAIEPWFYRAGPIHFEHGHLWDPDNAPLHPLVPTLRSSEPLGVALTRQVLAPTGAFQFAHAHHTTPLQGLIRVLRELRFRAPELIVRYFVAGAKIFLHAAARESKRAFRDGTQAIEEYAAGRALPADVLTKLEALRPLPRHARAKTVFARLYMDRALATVVTASSLTLGAVSADMSYLLLAAAGALYLALSKGDRAYRYSASLVERVRQSALQVVGVVDARLVVFGHTHVEEALPGYVNTGTFGFASARGRPFLLANVDGTVHRGYLERDGNCRTMDLGHCLR